MVIMITLSQTYIHSQKISFVYSITQQSQTYRIMHVNPEKEKQLDSFMHQNLLVTGLIIVQIKSDEGRTAI